MQHWTNLGRQFHADRKVSEEVERVCAAATLACVVLLNAPGVVRVVAGWVVVVVVVGMVPASQDRKTIRVYGSGAR